MLLARARRATAADAAARRRLPDGVLNCRIAFNEHGAYAVPRSVEFRPAARLALRGDVYERDTIDFLCRIDPAADVVHAGTFFGDFLPAIARSRTAGARVYAFEPNPDSFRCAQITLLLNDLPNVVLTHAALSAKTGLGQLAVRSPDGLALGGGSHLVLEPPDDIATTQVPVTSVDTAVPGDRRVAVVHLDVEGHEEEALMGALETIRRWRPVLVLETPPRPEWVAQHLSGLGYADAGRVSLNTVFATSRDLAG